MASEITSTVDATPVKSFFIKMLTRDIELADAILDLLDNCIDGVLRQTQTSLGESPYKGFWAEIKFDHKSFVIFDNCGGIPQEFQHYAFRMGKEVGDIETGLPMVGVYGIGMKRAIFKIGEQCSISTQSNGEGYRVDITPDWMNDPLDWKLPIFELAHSNMEDGTRITIDRLNEGVAARFGDNEEHFTGELIEKVKTHYAFILDKGFQVKVNGIKVAAKPTRLIFADSCPAGDIDPPIRPYMFQAESGGVNIFLCVGFLGNIPSQEEINAEQEKKQFSSMNAGWTIICNDRAVVYNDRTELTGWGDADVPRYHTQFIAIAGIVAFQSNDPKDLPTTTTKRGIDASSPLYLKVKRRMIEGMQMFTNYTNRWKGRAQESRQHTDGKRLCTLDELKTEFPNLQTRRVSKGLPGDQFKHKLPAPKTERTSRRRISYSKHLDDIQVVREYLFGDQNLTNSQVGEGCFDLILEDAKR